MSTTARFYITAGTSSYLGREYVALDLDADTVIYQRYNGQTPEATTANISYTKSTGLWHEGPGSATPGFLNSVNSSVGASASVLDANTIYCFNDQYAFRFSFESPWYEEPATGTEGTNSTSVSYIVEDNELRIVISPDEETTEVPGQTASGYRDTYYQLRKVSGTNFFQQIVHTKGWSTYHTIVPPSPGTYLLERVRTNPVEYHSFNSVEVTQAQLDAWHSANNGHIFYDSSENYLHYFIHSSEDTTNLLFGSAGRELFYRVRSVNQSVHNFNHLHDYDTNGTYRPTAHGIYHLERVLTNPSEVLSYAYAEVTQSQLDAWNLLNAPPGDDSGNNAPPNTPRRRRGNHNFW